MKRNIYKIFKISRIKIFILWILLFIGCYRIFGDWIKDNLFLKEESKPPEQMHLVAVSCGRPNYQGIRDLSKPMDQTITMLKSAALFAQAPLHAHIFTEEDMISLFENEFYSWPDRILSRMNYSLYKIDYDKHLPKALVSEWKKWYKPCGSFRLFAPMILQEKTSAAIYSDSDVVFVKPIDELWAQLKLMKPREVAAISPTAGHPLGGSKYNEHFISHSTGLFQINSGVMVMNFTRMLQTDWLVFYDEKSDAEKQTVQLKYGPDLLLAYYKEYKESAEHDQKLLNIMFHYNPELLKQLPCSWNFKHNFCQDDNNVCRDAEFGEGAGAVHGITSAFFGDTNPTFRALYETFLQYDFEEDLDGMLLQPLLKQLKSTAVGTFCGSKARIITEPLTKTIKQLLIS